MVWITGPRILDSSRRFYLAELPPNMGDEMLGFVESRSVLFTRGKKIPIGGRRMLIKTHNIK